MQSQSRWIPAPASKGGGGGQRTAREAPQRPPGAGGFGQAVGEASEVRPIGKYLEPLAKGRPPWGDPAPMSRPRRGRCRKTQPQVRAPGRGEASPACPQAPTGPAWPGCQESPRRVAAGRKRGGFLENEQRLQALPSFYGRCPHSDMGPGKPHGSLEAADGVWQGLLRCFPDDIILAPWFSF